MRILIRAVAVLSIVVVVIVLGVTVHVARTWDRVWDAPLPDVHASRDPEVIKRGEYLVFGPAHCVECHVGSWQEYEHSLDSGQRPALRGGIKFAAAPLGAIYSRNLTPDPETGIGRYSDGQLARMMRYSVRPDGRASVLPLMPFDGMSDADLTAIVSFLRAQPPARHVVPTNEWTLIGKVIKSFSPTFKPRSHVVPAAQTPPAAPTRERGAYLARSVANCVGCHSPRSPLTFEVSGVEFSGGNEMEPSPVHDADPAIWFKPPNLTPEKTSALLKFPDRETFVARFLRGGRQHQGSPMPWECFGRMSADDVGALYEYLHSLTPSPGPTGDPTIRKTN